ncbi:hypothetical protein EYB53_016075 [Candidatus Chloroploca sp. M-50]|uniref:Cardiolipin synthase N-terminal domain-containing protein n=1 Tax=Candidatus Chloroploca mongolica TaxID=2528176 RepID=A0ABS4DCR6_9CHLR|nr:hypothetical protein [Candidatus Chloroploca mongolica]MBP1467231.1 hypothetical protein [Candidatus Chloroploca mongolica]
MSFQDWMLWILSVTLLSIYIAAVFTVCRLTFQKGYGILGIIGIFFPILWLIGAILPAKPGSRFALQQELAMKRQAEQASR